MKIRIALDRLPCPVYTGIFVALDKGWYRDVGLDVEIVPPLDDNNEKSSFEKLVHREVTLSVNSSENIIHYQDSSGSKAIKAIATLLQGNMGFFATTLQIKNAHELDGKKYGFLGLPYESETIRNLIIAAGGNGDVQLVPTPKAKIARHLLDGKIDAAWVFDNQEELIEAHQKKISVKKFNLEHYGIPYGHSPVLSAHEEDIDNYYDELKRFIDITSRSYIFSYHFQEDAVEHLYNCMTTFGNTDIELMKKMQVATSKFYLNKEGQWGLMKYSQWENYVGWLKHQRLLKNPQFNIDDCYTNEFLLVMSH